MNIIIVANKWWEVLPLVSVMQHINPAQPGFSAAPIELYGAYQPAGGSMTLPTPRLALMLKSARIEVWCVQDLMSRAENSSCTWEKARVLPAITEGKDENLVIAFGTAASPTGNACNGNVVIGTSVFVHDPYSGHTDREQQWTHRDCGRLVESDAQPIVEGISRGWIESAEKRLIPAVNASANPPRIRIGSDLVAVGVVNVLDSKDYKWADAQALMECDKCCGGKIAESVETTHGVIRMVLNCPFIYVSGIANAVGMFEGHVKANNYAQNLVAAHNAAVGVAWLVTAIVTERG